MADAINRDGVAILVPAPQKAVKAARVNVTLPGDVLARVDAYAAEHGLTRSGFLALAAKKAMAA